MKSIFKNMIFAMSILIICALSTACGSDFTNYTPTTLQTQEQPVDLSAFQEHPEIEATIHVEKEGSRLYINAFLTNKSDKNIDKCVLYIAPEYVGTNCLSSYDCEEIAIQNIPANGTEHTYAFEDAKIAEIKECCVFVAYVLYDGGIEWGRKEIDHRAIIEKSENKNITVCLYEDGIPNEPSDKEYHVSYSINMLSNNHVGDEWYFGVEANEEALNNNSNVKITTHKDGGPIITIWALENDKNDDYAQKNIIFQDLSAGESETITEQIVVWEGDGRYTGNEAYIEFTVTVKRVGQFNNQDVENPQIKDEQECQKEDNVDNNESSQLLTENMNLFLVHYILPQYVGINGQLYDGIEYDSGPQTEWCYRLTGCVGEDSYEAIVYPFQLGKGNEITDLWIAYLQWNNEVIIQNDYSEKINYTPKKYW